MRPLCDGRAKEAGYLGADGYRYVSCVIEPGELFTLCAFPVSEYLDFVLDGCTDISVMIRE